MTTTISQSGLTVWQTGNPERWLDVNGKFAINIKNVERIQNDIGGWYTSLDILLESQGRSTFLHFNDGIKTAIKKVLRHLANDEINFKV